MLRVLLALLAVLTSLLPTFAQSNSDTATVSEIVSELKSKTPKCVVLILDVSESMKVDDYNRKMHDSVETILRESLADGDQAILYSFGAGYKKVFDETPSTPAARHKLIDQIPLRPEPGEGTNIRQPHHEALKLAKASGKTPYIIILTDSFNDPPKNTPVAYTEYQKYYTVGKLETYPTTPENRDYESLLSWMTTAGGKTYGIGVEILPSGRPKERFKVAPKTGIEATPQPEATPVPQRSAPVKEESLPLGWIGALVALGLGGAAFALLRPKPLPLRIVGGGSSARDFDVRGATTVRLGGEGAAASLDAFPVAGVKETVATIRASRGQLLIQPQPANLVRVYHNGMPLDKPTPLRYGDEVRIAVLDSNGAILKENRIKFSDPTKTF